VEGIWLWVKKSCMSSAPGGVRNGGLEKVWSVTYVIGDDEDVPIFANAGRELLKREAV